ncbi:36183_t:CDS:2 [Racocetra persica]|uniref:36183_t:CDS:1 n=1 Tax=Racocetra persica TaxID=160502 RepID=A0ACA9KZZ7_9GLOM|nr:36183_t:CDS:2 [Racocetra persica]
MSPRNSRQKETKNTTKSLALKKSVAYQEKMNLLKVELNKLSKSKNNLEQFRKENEEHKRYYEQTQQTIFSEYLSTIEYLQNRVDQLELYLGIGTSNYIVKNESSDKSSKSGDKMGDLIFANVHASGAATFASSVVAMTSVAASSFAAMSSVAASSDIPDSEYIGDKADSTNNPPEQITKTTSNQPLLVIDKESIDTTWLLVEFSEQCIEESTKKSSKESSNEHEKRKGGIIFKNCL